MCLESPKPPSPGDAYTQTLQAQLNSAPQIYAANAQYSPLYNQLGLQNLSSFLNGQNGQGGFLQQYQNNIMPALTNAQNAANTSLRTSGVNDAMTLAPSLTALARLANPGGAGLLDTVTSNTTRDLGYGTALTPEEKTQLNQSVRGGSAARGLGFGPDDVFNESMADTGMGQQLYQQRQGAAQSLVPQLQNFYGNPLSVTGMNSNNGMNAGTLTSTAGGSVAPTMLSQFNPAAGAGQLMGYQYESNVAGANNQNALTGALIGQGPGLASSGLNALTSLAGGL